jgi:sugar/nucleoside kinase (ribokinase family)
MHKSIDILGLGCTAVDELLYVDAYPPEDGKTPVRRRERQCGGLTATAMVAGARLGCHCFFAGTLGNDESSQFVVQRFREEGIDVTLVCRREEARPVRATIIINPDRQTRTIFYDPKDVFGADPHWPKEDVIRSARVLLVDDYGAEGMIRAATICRDAGIPVVADFEIGGDPRFPQLLALVDHLVLSRAFAQKLTRCQDPAAAARALWAPGRKAVVVTCGVEGCWYVSHKQPETLSHQPAIPVAAVDTTGCGDVFHGAYAAALAYGWDIPTALRFAATAAGLKATQRGGQAGIPTRAAVEAHMATAFPDHA